jgi:RNA polymerase sigma-70 factor (ECF subfamily)
VIPLDAATRTDAEIIEGLERGDPSAGRELYDRYGDLVNRLVWRLLGADAEHDDVVHVTFVNILASIGKLKNPASLRSWVMGVTVNTVRKEIRSRSYRRILHLVPDTPHVPDETRDDHLLGCVIAALGKLGADERIAFTLHHVEGQSLPETAAVTGCSLATVKRRIARAREAMARELRRDARLAAVVEEMTNEE